MKTTKILYWVFTGLFGLGMFASGVQNLMVDENSVALIADQLHFPKYIIPFLGAAKMVGALGILIPGLPKWIKEWAYAGLFFDLTGATYSVIAVTGFQPSTLGMLIFFVPGVLSYIYYHKKLKGE
jgi:hypothetical protein